LPHFDIASLRALFQGANKRFQDTGPATPGTGRHISNGMSSPCLRDLFFFHPLPFTVGKLIHPPSDVTLFRHRHHKPFLGPCVVWQFFSVFFHQTFSAIHWSLHGRPLALHVLDLSEPFGDLESYHGLIFFPHSIRTWKLAIASSSRNPPRPFIFSIRPNRTPPLVQTSKEIAILVLPFAILAARWASRNPFRSAQSFSCVFPPS